MNVFSPGLRLLGRAVAVNGSPITVSSGLITLLTPASLTIRVGDLLIVSYQVQMTKGGTQGSNLAELVNVGAGAVTFNNAAVALRSGLSLVAAGATWRVQAAAVGICTTAGVWQPQLQALSDGSDSSLAAGEAGYHILLLR